VSTADFDAILARLEAARDDPRALALATLDICLAGREPLLRSAVEAAAIPHWFDTDILRALLPDAEARIDDLLQELAKLPMVETFKARGGWNVHELTRLALRERMARDEPARLAELSALAAAQFAGDASERQIECVFHRLNASPAEGAAELYALSRAWDDAGRHETLQALGVALDELARGSPLVPIAEAQVKLRLGVIRSDRLAVAERMVLARRALELFRACGDVQGIVDALDFRGDIEEDSGEIEHARASYVESFKSAKSAAALDPDSTHWRRELAVAHSKIGRVFQAQGKLDAALAEYQEYKRIMAELAVLDPANDNWQRELSVSHNNVGGIFQAQGKLDAALDEYQESKRIMADLAALDPANAGWQRDLSVSHNNVGGIFRARGKLDAALAEYQESKRIMADLAAVDPANTGWQRGLSVSHHCVGGIFQAQGKLDAALAEYQEYKRFMAELAVLDPGNANWQRELSVSHNNVGGIFQAQGKLDAALAEYQAGMRIMAELTALDPANTGWQRDLSVSHNHVGGIFEVQGKLDAALAEFQADLRIAETLVALDPSNAVWREDLRITRDCVESLRRKLDQA